MGGKPVYRETHASRKPMNTPDKLSHVRYEEACCIFECSQILGFVHLRCSLGPRPPPF